MAHIIHAYHPEARLPEDEAQLRALYCTVLQGQRALILLDNALDRAQVEPLLPAAGVPAAGDLAAALHAARPAPPEPGRPARGATPWPSCAPSPRAWPRRPVGQRTSGKRTSGQCMAGQST